MNTFHWPKMERSSWLLAGFIFLSLILHSGAFFLFNAMVPIRPPAPKAAQPVQLLTATGPDGLPSPENVALLEWIASADPALVAQVPNVPAGDLMKVPYHPSFATMHTAPLGVPEESDAIQFPSARDPVALILGNAQLAAEKPADVVPQPTRVSFSTQISGRAPAFNYAPAVRATMAVQPTRLLIGITAEGEVHFAYLQPPASGSPALDADALAAVRDLHFAPAPKVPVAWGFATFTWGDDAITNPAQ